VLVYGDRKFKATLTGLVLDLRNRVAALCHPDLEGLRTVLIQAGQLEQAVQDQSPRSAEDTGALSLQVQQITDKAAAAFYAYWAESGGCPKGSFQPEQSLARMLERLGQLDCSPDVVLNVKVPEGFEFYALYPEQYCASTVRWAAEHSFVQGRRAVVVGIRSIGTTLSAVVAAALDANGWQAHRFTIRPGGDVFKLQALVARADRGDAEWGLIVDEGPGLSGSSMAAVAEALAAVGLQRDHLAFFPGHDQEPGPAATPSVRQLWASIPRVFTPVTQLQWNSLSLQDSLLAKTSEICPEGHWNVIKDLGGGLWRQFYWPDATDWPAVNVPFERPKYRCAAEDGGPAILWKSVGLGAATDARNISAETCFQKMVAKAEQGWSPRPLGVFRGFIAMPWLDGRLLSPSDAAAPGVLEHVGRYLVQTAGPPLFSHESESGLKRLAEMLSCNTAEALDEAQASCAARWGEFVRRRGVTSDIEQSFGDGHLAPYEWIRGSDGRILKADCFGHEADHTLIGKQSLAWDIAGAISEWQLDDSDEVRLLLAIRNAGIEFDPAFLFFHRLAYAAFRMGQTSLCAGLSSLGPPEQARLCRAQAGYRNELNRLLKAHAFPGSFRPD